MQRERKAPQLKLPFEQYGSGRYLEQHPTWDSEDCEWKASQVRRMLQRHALRPATIVEVGCGSGAVLACLRKNFQDSKLEGYDIAADAGRFWSAHRSLGIRFVVGDFLQAKEEPYDLLLMLDVIEHLADPFAYLTALHGRAERYLFHVPLDLSALSVARGSPLLNARRFVGHIHYFTKDLALSLIRECGFSVIDWFYTEAWKSGPRRGSITRMAMLPRMLMSYAARDFATRLLGGETLMVLAATDRR